jgi:Secretion system C-terminal sorting domain
MKAIHYLIICFFLLGLSSQSQNLLPTIPNYNTNPFVSSMFFYVRLNATDFTGDSIGQGREVEQTAIAYCHPQSTHRGALAYKTRLLLLLDHIFSLPGDFGSYSQAVYGYAILKQEFPNDISATQKTKWEAAIKSITDTYLASIGNRWIAKDIRPVWYNAEVRWALGIYLSGVVLNNQAYKTGGSAFFDEVFQLKMIQGDGGINYVGYQNEVLTYHGFNIDTLTWYYLITGDLKVKNLIKKTVNYYPLSIAPNGVAEYYTAVSWKHYWNQNNGDDSAYVVASITGDSYNYAVGKTGTRNPLLAFFYNPNLKDPTTNPDNFVAYDRNILGPRARYGTWNYAGTSRKVDDNAIASNLNGMGKNTLVGAMVLDNTGAWPLNAALDIASVEVRVDPGQDTEVRRNGSDWLTTKELSTVTKGKQIYGLASEYNTSTKKASNASVFSASNWDVKQEWVFTPERLVGMIEINPTVDTQAYAVQGILKFVSGRSTWGTKKDLVSLGNGSYTYGKLNIKIRENNFGGALNQIYSSVYEDTDSSQKGTILNLKDNKSNANTDVKMLYKTTDKYHYIVEVYPQGTTASTTVTNNSQTNLQSFTVNDGKRAIQMIHNHSDQQQVYTASINFSYTKAVITKSWTTIQNLGTVSGLTQVSITIPAHEQVLIINSNTTADLDGTNQTADNLFNTTTLSNEDFVDTINNSITIYPNPVIDLLNIKGLHNTDGSITLYDMTGKSILNNIIITNENQTLDFSKLASGIYILKTNSGKVMRFMKQ